MKTMANVLKVQRGPDLTSSSDSHEGVSLTWPSGSPSVVQPVGLFCGIPHKASLLYHCLHCLPLAEGIFIIPLNNDTLARL